MIDYQSAFGAGHDNYRFVGDTTGNTELPAQLDVLSNGQVVAVYGDWVSDSSYNHQQGKNTFGFANDCGLVSCQDVILQHGIHVSEADVCRHAIQNSECDDAMNPKFGASPDNWGMTSASDQARLLNDYGIPAQTKSGETIDTLASQVQSGDHVILSVNAGVLWGDPKYYEGGSANHAVTVTSVVRDYQTGQVLGVVLNDSGNGKTEFVSADTLQQAWCNAGGNCVVAK